MVISAWDQSILSLPVSPQNESIPHPRFTVGRPIRVESGPVQVENGLAQVESGPAQMESALSWVESGPAQQSLCSWEMLLYTTAHMSTIAPGQFYCGSPTKVKAEPLQVKLLTPFIRVCACCRGGYNSDASSHSDYVILVGKKQQLYYNVVTGRQQPSSMMNVHNHANLSCTHIWYVRCLSFNPTEVEIPEKGEAKLLNKVFLIRTVGIAFVFAAVKVPMHGFVHLAFSVTWLVHITCSVSYSHWPKTRACK